MTGADPAAGGTLSDEEIEARQRRGKWITLAILVALIIAILLITPWLINNFYDPYIAAEQ